MLKRKTIDRIRQLVYGPYGIVLILLLASFARLYALGSLPEGTYTDEAYGAYLAYGILTEGIDDWGYHFPVYFVAWGSGMNALYLYLGAIFFRLFGVSILVYRLPQALFGILAVFTLYRICEILFDRRFALFAAFALAVNPWHIQMCRFALESNLAPNVFLIGLMFLVLAIHGANRKATSYFCLAAAFLGLSLYAYALMWLFLPLFLVLTIVFLWRRRPAWKESFLFTGILFLLAVPLLLFLLINYGFLPEIRTSYFSIPKLTGFRGEELAFSNFILGAKKLFRLIFIEQGDGRVLLSFAPTGAYYYFTAPFMVFGLLAHAFFLIKKKRQAGEFDVSILMLLWFGTAFLVCACNASITMVHVNLVHIPACFYGAYGIWQVCKLLRKKWVPMLGVAAYGICFVYFFYIYSSSYGFPDFFGENVEEALLVAKEAAGEDGEITIVGFDDTFKYPNLLWREKFPIGDYAANKVMDGHPYFEELLEYGNYTFISHEFNVEEGKEDGVYLMKSYMMDEFEAMGFEVVQVGETYAVAVRK